MPDFLKFLLGGAGGGLLANAYNRLGDVGDTGLQLGQNLAQTQLEQTEFKPYTITSATGGGFSAGPGGYSMNLGQGQGLQNALFGQASQFLNQPAFGLEGAQAASSQAGNLGSQFMEQAGMSTVDREQDIYRRMRAAQTPEENRAALELEQRLAAQGRLGVKTAQFGGTPEQLSLAKAREEAKNQAMLGAMGQAQAEQAQQAQLGAQYAGLGSSLASQALGLQAGQQQLGLGALSGAYIPQRELIAALSPGQTAAAQQQQAQMYGAGLFGEASVAGIDTYLASALGQANLAGSLGSGLLGGALGSGFDFDFDF